MKISSHTGFQPLKEVWLGDTYPSNYYDDFSNQEQDLLCEISEKTKEDLTKIQKKLIDLDVTVRRPEFDSKEKFLDEDDNLCKPPITPRDWAITIADCLYIIPQYPNAHCAFDNTVKLYKDCGQKVKILDRSIPDPLCYINPPSVVRVGKDLYCDCDKNFESYNFFLEGLEQFKNDYRIHITHTGEHSDGIFCPVKPKCIFSTHYKQCYKDTFPDWKINFLPDTTQKRKNQGIVGSWWVSGKDYAYFNRFILDKAKKWIGNVQETIFEVNMLVVDEKNILCIAEDDWACKKLEEYGFNVHICDFTNRHFWDGGLHCLTLDIFRKGDCIDYWPERGNTGFYFYD